MTEKEALLALDPTYATHGDPEVVVKRTKAIIDAYDNLDGRGLPQPVRPTSAQSANQPPEPERTER